LLLIPSENLKALKTLENKIDVEDAKKILSDVKNRVLYHGKV
jgi:hypothetical protein